MENLDEELLREAAEKWKRAKFVTFPNVHVKFANTSKVKPYNIHGMLKNNDYALENVAVHNNKKEVKEFNKRMQYNYDDSAFILLFNIDIYRPLLKKLTDGATNNKKIIIVKEYLYNIRNAISNNRLTFEYINLFNELERTHYEYLDDSSDIKKEALEISKNKLIDMFVRDFTSHRFNAEGGARKTRKQRRKARKQKKTYRK